MTTLLANTITTTLLSRSSQMTAPSLRIGPVIGSSSSSSSREETRLVVIVGATGTGKTKLSIDVARAVGGEVVNADKIQLYAGLDVTTNKVPVADRRGVRHHLLGALRQDAGALPPSSYRSLAATKAAWIAARGCVPIIAGGSNSLVHALIADYLDDDPFSTALDRLFYRPALRFPCCILWVDVEGPLLAEYLDRRVDDMMEGGMVEELREYFAATTPSECAAGLGNAIGVQELGGYLAGWKSLHAAVDEIKTNTRVLAAAQASKIRHMADGWGWPVRRLDASAAVRARLAGAGQSAEWERDVRGPGLAAIRSFLDEVATGAVPRHGGASRSCCFSGRRKGGALGWRGFGFGFGRPPSDTARPVWP